MTEAEAKNKGLSTDYDKLERSYLPPEWSSDECMRTLMAPMPPVKDSVPYQSRYNFWASAINNWCCQKKILTFSLQECSEAFCRGSLIPRCLDDTVELMVKNGSLIPLERLEKAAQSQSWFGWGRKLLSENASWAWQSVIGQKGSSLKDVFINNKLLANMEDVVVRSIQPTPHLYETRSFMQLHTSTSLEIYSPDYLRVVVLSMTLSHRAGVLEKDGTTYVKIANYGSRTPVVFNDSDIAEVKLSVVRDELDNRIASLSKEIEKLDMETKEALRLKMKMRALASLRQKKHVEHLFMQQLSARDNVAKCFLHLQDSKLHGKVLEAFKLGLKALKGMVETSYSGDKVASTMDEIQDVLEECNDVGDLMAGQISIHGETVDEGELEKELENLVLEPDVPLTEEKEGASFPKVPDDNLAERLKELSVPLPT